MSTMKMMEGLATSSTPMVRRLRCSTLSPLCPGSPTRDPFRDVSSIRPITCTSGEVQAGVRTAFSSAYPLRRITVQTAVACLDHWGLPALAACVGAEHTWGLRSWCVRFNEH